MSWNMNIFRNLAKLLMEITRKILFDYFQVGMPNSSFIYAVDEESVELSTPYLLSPIELRPVAWDAIREAGRDMAPAG